MARPALRAVTRGVKTRSKGFRKAWDPFGALSPAVLNAFVGVHEAMDALRASSLGVQDPSMGIQDPSRGIQDSSIGIQPPHEGVPDPADTVRDTSRRLSLTSSQSSLRLSTSSPTRCPMTQTKHGADKQSVNAVNATSASTPTRVLKRKRTPPLGVTSAVLQTPQVVPNPVASGALTGIENAAQPPPVTAPIPTPLATGSTPVATPSTTPATASAASVTPTVADPVPTVGAPPVHSTFVAGTKLDNRGFFPNGAELAAMPNAALDLLRFTDFTALLGASAMPAPALASAITLAIQWRQERDASNAWDACAKAQDAFAWRDAMNGIDEVRPLFLFAVSKNPALATTYPWLSQLFNVPKMMAKQAAASRANAAKKAKKAAATAAAKGAETAAAVAPAATTAQVPAGGAATPTPVTPTKTVTVNT